MEVRLSLAEPSPGGRQSPERDRHSPEREPRRRGYSQGYARAQCAQGVWQGTPERDVMHLRYLTVLKCTRTIRLNPDYNCPSPDPDYNCPSPNPDYNCPSPDPKLAPTPTRTEFQDWPTRTPALHPHIKPQGSPRALTLTLHLLLRIPGLASELHP